MANEEHLEILKMGVDVWNRPGGPYVDLACGVFDSGSLSIESPYEAKLIATLLKKCSLSFWKFDRKAARKKFGYTINSFTRSMN